MGALDLVLWSIIPIVHQKRTERESNNKNEDTWQYVIFIVNPLLRQKEIKANIVINTLFKKG